MKEKLQFCFHIKGVFTLFLCLAFSLWAQESTIPLQPIAHDVVIKQIMKNRLMMVYFGKPLANTNEYSSASGAYNFRMKMREFTMELLLQ
jgi:hypothetical protein